MKKRKTRDSGCCSINITKGTLHVFNIIFFLSGIAVTGVSIWTIFWKQHLAALLVTHTYAFLIYGLAIAGIISTIGAILGLCGIWREQSFLIAIYIFILLLAFVLEAVVGGLAYFYETQVAEELNITLNGTFLQSYSVDERRTEAIDWVHQRYACCGAIRFEDWRLSEWARQPTAGGRRVPDSCCVTVTEGCGRRDHPSNIPYTGCIYSLTEELKAQLIILAGVGAGICLVHIFGIVLSCCLYVKLKRAAA